MELSFEIDKTIPVIPGCSIDIEIEFNWHNRIISGKSLYKSGVLHGTVVMSGLKRGEYTTKGACFIITDAAGFFRFRKFAGNRDELRIKPVPLLRDELPRIMGSGGDTVSRMIRRKRSDELTETRQYYPGDDVRRINWRAFAHTGGLFIRMGEELPNPESHLLVVADLSGSGMALLKPNQLDSYLDYLVDSLSGIIERLNEAGVNVDCIIPPGRSAADAGNDAFVSLWWSDLEFPSAAVKKKHGGCLIVSPAFSQQAGAHCRNAAEAGMSVSVIVPVPPSNDGKKRKNLLHRLLFKQQQDGWREYSDIIMPQAEGLISGLRELKGVNSAQII